MSHIIKIQGYSIAYNKIGNGPRNAVLVHGWGSSKAWWQTMAEGLAQTHTCYVPDLLGFGGSTKPAQKETFHIEHQTEIMANLIRQLALAPVYLIGHSMGGMISVTLAYRYPELVERLAVFNLVVTGRCNSFFRLGQIALAIPLLGRPLYAAGQSVPKSTLTTYTRSLKMMLAHQPAALKRPEIQEFITRAYPDFKNTPTRSLEFALRAFTTFDLRPFMDRVKHPTLVICGLADKQIPPEDSQILANGLPNARLECFESAGHSPFMEYPERCLGLLQHFANGKSE
ncbi:MAG: alpha/beta hydrolase [Anaerolineae bacterium]|nr:alpha/beta hydrolase [Anaerolineae bacterium]